MLIPINERQWRYRDIKNVLSVTVIENKNKNFFVRIETDDDDHFDTRSFDTEEQATALAIKIVDTLNSKEK